MIAPSTLAAIGKIDLRVGDAHPIRARLRLQPLFGVGKQCAGGFTFDLEPHRNVPTYEEGDLVLFETGAIIFHIAERHPGLLPEDTNARARAITWMFAALNTVEPPIVEREQVPYAEGDKPWYAARLPMIEDRIRVRLDDLSRRLGEANWLDGAFSAGDLMMILVLRRLEGTGILEEYPKLSAYVARGEARPAYKRAFADQLAVFTGKPSAG